MSELPALFYDLALILVTAGIATVIFKWMKQPVVLGYIIAGFLIGPNFEWFPVINDHTSVETWSEIGMVFMLFGIGLEFSFKKLKKVGGTVGITALTELITMCVVGFLLGKILGWSQMDCIFLGAMLSISSTTIIAKAFDDMKLNREKFSGNVIGELVVEDLEAVLLMVILSTMAVSKTFDGMQLVYSMLKLLFFLVVWFLGGIFLVPTVLRWARKFMSEETLTVFSVGLCFLMVVLANLAGFSSALGAFIMGSILAETLEAEKIHELTTPIKNLFGAIFFVSVGMLVDPMILIEYALPIATLVLTILIGQAIFGSFSFMLGGESLKSAMRCGFSMAQIGEFSFIIASLGLSLGVIGNFLYPVVVAVSVITTFLTPYMIRFSTPAYNNLERHLPKKLITSLNKKVMNQPNTQKSSLWKRLLTQMAMNVLVYSILSSATIAVMLTFVQPFVQKILPGEELYWYANAITGALTILFISPFLRAMVMKKNHSEEWKALWAESNRNRLPLIVTILVRALIALFFIFYVCNYLGSFSKALIITIGVVILAFIIFSRWIKKRSISLERLFVLNLRSRDIKAQVMGKKRPLYEGKLLDRDIHIADFDIPYNSGWMGQTLKQLNLGQKYGIHVSSILRGGWRLNIPDGDYIIFPGDVLQVIGSDEQFAAFRDALEGSVVGEDPDLEKREMKLQQMIIGSDSPFIGKNLIESKIRDLYSCMIVGLEEGKESLSAYKPDRKFQEGDIIWVVGEQESLDALLSIGKED